MSALAPFELLSSETGIALPDCLRRLLATGYTSYGPDWASTWRDRALTGRAPCISWYDFEWIDAAKARREIEEWLNPEAQAGKVFLPFAETGSGDVYGLMPIDGHSVGVALIFHDDPSATISYESFDDFVAVQFLEAFANLDHLTDEFSNAQVLQCLEADIACVAGALDGTVQNYLGAFLAEALMLREFRFGPNSRPKQVLSLIHQGQLEIELARFERPRIEPFEIVARWEVRCRPAEINEAKPIEDWRSLALNPGRKFAAIQDYQKEFNVNLAEAKAAVDEYIANTQKSTLK